MEDIGKMLVGLGITIVLLGALLMLGGKVPWIGRLPGDIAIQNANYSCIVPLATSILLSIVITLLLNFLIC